MPLQPIQVFKAVSKGLAVPCATCTKYWSARDRGIPEPRCLSVEGCGSPLVGDVFHEYEGPIPDLKEWCFVCGDKSTHAVSVQGKVGQVGLCKTHVSWLSQYRPIGEVVDLSKIVVISPTGPFLIKEPKKTLMEVMEEEEEKMRKDGT